MSFVSSAAVTGDSCSVGFTVALFTPLRSISPSKVAETPEISSGRTAEMDAVALAEVSLAPGDVTVRAELDKGVIPRTEPSLANT